MIEGGTLHPSQRNAVRNLLERTHRLQRDPHERITDTRADPQSAKSDQQIRPAGPVASDGDQQRHQRDDKNDKVRAKDLLLERNAKDRP